MYPSVKLVLNFHPNDVQSSILAFHKADFNLYLLRKQNSFEIVRDKCDDTTRKC